MIRYDIKHTILIFSICYFWLAGCSPQTTGQQPFQSPDYPDSLQIITRAQWGWQPLDSIPQKHHISKITIHHGGEEFAETKDPVTYLRNLQTWSRNTKHWMDIPYHFMIDLQGRIYETRPLDFPGDTNTDYDVRGHALICVMGNYEIQTLKPEQLQAVINLSSFLADRYNIPADSIRGHKDYTTTACPGQDLYRFLQDGTIVNRVRDQLNRKKD